MHGEVQSCLNIFFDENHAENKGESDNQKATR